MSEFLIFIQDEQLEIFFVLVKYLTGEYQFPVLFAICVAKNTEKNLAV